MKTIQSDLSKLVLNEDAKVSRTNDDFLQITSPEDKEAVVTYLEQIKIPLKMDLIAKTDSTNIRLKCGKGQVIFNWEGNLEELHVSDPLLGNPYGVMGKGLLPVNEFVHISWIIDNNYMVLLVDGEVRHFSENEPYMAYIKEEVNIVPECTVGFACAMGSVLTVQEFTVAEWKHDEQSHNPIALHINDGIRQDDRISGIGPNNAPIKMKPGESCTIEGIIFPETAREQKIIWSTNHNILKFNNDDNGKLTFTAVEQGSAIIKGEIEGGGLSAICHVKSFIPEFKTNLEQFNAISGEWTIENGLIGDGWDHNFMLSSIEVDDFIYEADVCVENGAASALVFRATANVEQFYCISLYPGPGGRIALRSPHKEIEEQMAEIQRHTFYHVKVVVKGDHIQVYLDDRLMIDVRDNSYSSGYLGLNIFYGTSIFQNVMYAKI
ncbi:Ig-like domain-containing protein [Paenibacillus thermotolerans]|uniref:Ig-like domain-containing protein n=1 Tax=Paenibacillus thermotolerans TaxID=3027807 RepID=UPI002368237F|nr:MULTISPECIES: family 16 glycoside hydrolase [unclassified Paenibacillus]